MQLPSCSTAVQFLYKILAQRRRGKGKLKFMICFDKIFIAFYCYFTVSLLSGQLLFFLTFKQNYYSYICVKKPRKGNSLVNRCCCTFCRGRRVKGKNWLKEKKDIERQFV